MKEVLHALVVKASWRDLAAVFVSDKFIFVLIFYFEVCSSFFIYWRVVLLFYRGIVLVVIYWGYVPQVLFLRLCSSVWGFGPHCCRPIMLLSILLIWFVCCHLCVSVPVLHLCFSILSLFTWYPSKVTRRNYYLGWIYHSHFLPFMEI